MTSIPESSQLTEEEKGTVGLGNPPVLAEPADTVLSGRGLIKTFGRVVGLDGVDIDLFPGEVLSVIGDNGAGKSTLIKALTGALIPDSGNVYLEGQEVHFRASGGISLQVGNPMAYCGPDGYDLRTLQQPLQDNNIGAVIGKVVLLISIEIDEETGE